MCNNNSSNKLNQPDASSDTANHVEREKEKDTDRRARRFFKSDELPQELST